MKLVQAMPIGLLLCVKCAKNRNMSYMNRMNKFVSNNESMEYRKEAVL